MVLFGFICIGIFIVFVIWCAKTSHTKEERKDIDKQLKDQHKRNSDYMKAMWGKKD